MERLVDNYKIKVLVIDEPSADTGDFDGDPIPTLDYQEFTFVAVLGNPVAGNVMRIQASDDGETYTDIPGAVAPTGPCQFVSVINHACNYMKPVIARVEATSILSVVSFRGNSSHNPQINDDMASAKGTVVVG